MRYDNIIMLVLFTLQSFTGRYSPLQAFTGRDLQISGYVTDEWNRPINYPEKQPYKN